MTNILKKSSDENDNRLMLRFHTATTEKNPEEGIRKAVSTLVNDFKIQKHLVNSIGRLYE